MEEDPGEAEAKGAITVAKEIYRSGVYVIWRFDELSLFGSPMIRLGLFRNDELILSRTIKIPATGNMSQFNVDVNKVLRYFKDVIESYQAQEGHRGQMAIESVDDAAKRLFGGPGGE